MAQHASYGDDGVGRWVIDINSKEVNRLVSSCQEEGAGVTLLLVTLQ